ncbi:storkhead box 1 isoform 1 [Schistosoma japonicum]|uniref:Storkhead box 1 isoform 1 n=1 Tax=Schistosoma japonicum TaxID=6182 RepID=A0A4Z2DPN0_SCHJA|nr:storkhead box 1 isoform 1 [Schistosoma japonicum]
MSISSSRTKCLAVSFCRHVQQSRFAFHVFDLFISFKYINIANQKDSWLSQAIQNCYLIGHVEPYLLLIGGSPSNLQTVKLSWDRGQLKSPFGFSINSVCRGYNLLTPEKLAVAKWLESVPETCIDTESVLDYSNMRKAPLAEAEPFVKTTSLYNPVNYSDGVNNNNQLRSARRKIGNTAPYRNTNALMPVPENLELDHLLRSFNAHSISPYHFRNNNQNHCNPVLFVSPTTSCLKHHNPRIPLNYRTNGINTNCTSRVIKSPKENFNKSTSIGVNDSLKIRATRSEIRLPHQPQLQTPLPTKYTKISADKKSHSSGLLKWLLERLQRVRLSWRRSHVSYVEDHIVVSPKYKTSSQSLRTFKDEYYVPTFIEKQVSQDRKMCHQSLSSSNLRRCFSLSDGGKSNKIKDQIMKNYSSCMETSFSPEILTADFNSKSDRKRSSYPGKYLHRFPQNDLHGRDSVRSLSVGSQHFPTNHFLSQSHEVVKSAPRLLASPSVLERNFSKNFSNVSLRHIGRKSTIRDSGFVEGIRHPCVSGSFIQSNFSKSSESSHEHHNFKPDHLGKAPTDSNFWWYTGSNCLAPSVEISKPLFTASNVM